MELHHPIMSKLWDLGGQTKRKKKERSKDIYPSYYRDFIYLDKLSIKFMYAEANSFVFVTLDSSLIF